MTARSCGRREGRASVIAAAAACAAFRRLRLPTHRKGRRDARVLSQRQRARALLAGARSRPANEMGYVRRGLGSDRDSRAGGIGVGAVDQAAGMLAGLR